MTSSRMLGLWSRLALVISETRWVKKLSPRLSKNNCSGAPSVALVLCVCQSMFGKMKSPVINTPFLGFQSLQKLYIRSCHFLQMSYPFRIDILWGFSDLFPFWPIWIYILKNFLSTILVRHNCVHLSFYESTLLFRLAFLLPCPFHAVILQLSTTELSILYVYWMTPPGLY